MNNNSQSNSNPLFFVKTVEEAKDVLQKDPTLIGCANHKGVLSIHFASIKGEPELINFLIQSGESIHSKTKNGKTPLHYASMGGNVSLIDLLTEDNFDINCADSKISCTALLYAAIYNQLPVVVPLLKKGSDIAACDSKGRSSLHYFVKNNNLPAASLLVQHSIPVDIKDKLGCTALHYAAATGNLDMVKLLIQSKANLTALDNNGHIPMHIASARNHARIVHEFLISKVPADYASPKNKNTSLYYGAMAGSIDIIRMLVQLGAEVFKQCEDSQTALHASAANGHLNCIKLLVELGANVTVEDSFGQTPLHKAAMRGHFACVEFLQRKAPHTVKYRDQNDRTPMALAGIGKHEKCMETLLQKEITSAKWKDKIGRTQLHWAAISGHHSFVREILSKGIISVDQIDKHGNTPLDLAISSGSTETVRVLLEHSSTITNTLQDGNSSIHFAAMIGNVEILQMMFGQRSIQEINNENQAGLTPLHLAIERGHFECSAFLIERGANPAALDSQGNSTLHRAVCTGNISIVKLLVANNVSPSVKNSQGVTPLHFAAATKNSHDIIDFLIASGANVNELPDTKDSPLHYSVKKGLILNILRLLELGADRNIRNSSDLLPVDYALLNNDQESILLLTQ